MSTWARELVQILGAIVAVLGLGLVVLAFHGPLVAAGAAVALLGAIGVAVGYVGVQGPEKAPVGPVDAESESVLRRTRPTVESPRAY